MLWSLCQGMDSKMVGLLICPLSMKEGKVMAVGVTPLQMSEEDMVRTIYLSKNSISIYIFLSGSDSSRRLGKVRPWLHLLGHNRSVHTRQRPVEDPSRGFALSHAGWIRGHSL